MPAFVRSVMRASFNLMPSSRAKDESRLYQVTASRNLRVYASLPFCLLALSIWSGLRVKAKMLKASRRTNPNNPAFYKPVRKALVRRLA